MRFRCIGLLLATTVAPTMAHAQAAASQNGVGVEEIVVTAQKRSENVQNVPIAISAFTASALKERAVGDVSQLSGISPNVTLDASTPFSGSNAVLGASIRGIGEADFAFNIDPAVGVYVDGVYLARSIGANQDLLDVDRIEVLKGPQGTLFGRNTIGGAISIVTHDPGKVFRFVGDFTTGSYNRMQARATVAVPLTNNLFSSLSFGVLSREGYQVRVPYPSTSGYTSDAVTDFVHAGYGTGDGRQGGDNNWNLRGKLKWEPASGLKVTLAADYSNVNQDAAPNTVLATTENAAGGLAGVYNACINLPAAVLSGIGLGGVCGPRSGSAGYNTLSALAGANVGSATGAGRLAWGSQWVNATGNIDTTYANGLNFSKLQQGGVELVVDGSIGHASLKSISSYRKVNFSAGTDQSGSPLQILALSFTVNQEQVSQEFQLTGKALDDKLGYVFGVYGFEEDGNLHDYVVFDEGLLQVDGPGRLRTVNYAGYGQLDYKFNDLVGLTLGGRYTHEEKTYHGFQSELNGLTYKFAGLAPNAADATLLGFPDPSQPLRLYPSSPDRQTFNNFSPKAGIQLHPTRAVMGYFSWSRGYKTGSWTTRLSAPLLVAPTYGPERAETFEIGVKSQWLDRRLQLNFAAFSTRYTGIQLTEQTGVSPTTSNLGNAQIKGLELEANVAPGHGLTLNSSISYLDAHYTYVCGQGGVLQGFCNGNSAYVAPTAAVAGVVPGQLGVAAGSDLPKAPHWKVNVSPRYEVAVGAGKLVFTGDWTYTSRMRNDTEGTEVLMRKATSIANASVTYKSPEDRYELTVGGTNITNQRYLVTGGSNVAAGLVFGTYSRPAEWYARIGVKF